MTLLQNGSVTLCWKESIFEQYIELLKQEDFDIHEFDCSKWLDIKDFHSSISSALRFPDYYGKNLDAFNDCLSDCIPEGQGIVLGFRHYDSFAVRLPKKAIDILDIINHNAWLLLLEGHKLIALIQTDNPEICFDNIGTVSATWNPKEWLKKDRG